MCNWGGNKKCRSSGQAVPRGFAPRFNALELLTAKLRRLVESSYLTKFDAFRVNRDHVMDLENNMVQNPFKRLLC